MFSARTAGLAWSHGQVALACMTHRGAVVSARGVRSARTCAERAPRSRRPAGDNRAPGVGR